MTTPFGSPSFGFSFGQQPNQQAPKPNLGINPLTTTASTGFTFGSMTSAPAQQRTGFTFGSPTSAPTTSAPAVGVSSSGFQLNTSNTGNLGSGFTFGAGATTGSGTSSTSFGGLGGTATSPSTGFTFGQPAIQAASPPQTTTTPAPGGFQFGATSSAAPLGGFSFGGSTTTASAIAPTSTPSSGLWNKGTSSGGVFTFGIPQTSTAASFGTTSAPSSTASGQFPFGMGTQSGLTASGLTLGGSSSSATPAVSFTAATPAASPFSTTTSSFLGLPSASIVPPAITSAPTASSTGFGFGMQSSMGAAVPATSASTTSSSLFGTPAITPFGTSVTASASPVVGPSSTPNTISSIGAQTTSGLPTAATSQSTTQPATGGFTLGMSAATTSAAPSATVTPSWSFGGAPSALAVSMTSTQAHLSTATLTVSSTAATTATPSINFRQLEEEINKWTLELEEQEKAFLTQATQVNIWDRLLIGNGEKITLLHDNLEKVKLDQGTLEQEIDFIRTQQRELEELLIPLEKQVETPPMMSLLQHADQEREHTYQLAEEVDAQLHRMTKDLKEIIEHLNASRGSQDSNNPMFQISKVLNAHMDSLQWIDQHTTLLQRKVGEVAKLYEARQKDQERLLRLTNN